MYLMIKIHICKTYNVCMHLELMTTTPEDNTTYHLSQFPLFFMFVIIVNYHSKFPVYNTILLTLQKHSILFVSFQHVLILQTKNSVS